jgi:hypothetical protein
LTIHRKEVEDKKSIINLFLARFTLTEQEVEIIRSRDTSIGSRFFHALDKTEKIRDDCRVLMAGEDGPTQSGYVLRVIVDLWNSNGKIQGGYHDSDFILP